MGNNNNKDSERDRKGKKIVVEKNKGGEERKEVLYEELRDPDPDGARQVYVVVKGDYFV